MAGEHWTREPEAQAFPAAKSQLPLLGADDPEVAADLQKVKFGSRLSPVLLVRGEPLWVADGYHRICASYDVDEKAEVPCRIVPRRRPTG